MAKLEFRGKTYTGEDEIRATLAGAGILFERWPLRGVASADEQVLSLYKPEVDRLMQERGYVAVDMVALRPSTPGLAEISARYDKEHHHVDDEVRFTVEGEGVFEIEGPDGGFLKFTATPGDLIVIPAYRRHLFYLTSASTIRCIRLFQDRGGWEALYEKIVN